jgi:hypothetical protein
MAASKMGAAFPMVKLGNLALCFWLSRWQNASGATDRRVREKMPVSVVGQSTPVGSFERGCAPMRRYLVPALSELAIVGLFFAAGIALIAFLK